jgi:hypothetical protein
MRSRHAAAIAMLATYAAFSGGCWKQKDVDSNATPPPGVVVAENVATGDGRTVTLRIGVPATPLTKGVPDPSDRCWYVTESSQDGRRLGTVSACGAGKTVSASVVLGAILVRSDCGDSPSVKAGTGPQTMFLTAAALRGIFVVPANALPANIDSLTYACVDAQGATGEPKNVTITR